MIALIPNWKDDFVHSLRWRLGAKSESSSHYKARTLWGAIMVSSRVTAFENNT